MIIVGGERGRVDDDHCAGRTRPQDVSLRSAMSGRLPSTAPNHDGGQVPRPRQRCARASACELRESAAPAGAPAAAFSDSASISACSSSRGVLMSLSVEGPAAEFRLSTGPRRLRGEAVVPGRPYHGGRDCCDRGRGPRGGARPAEGQETLGRDVLGRRLPPLKERLYPPMPRDFDGGWIATLAITAIAAILRFWNLGNPVKFVFDETYYAKDAFRCSSSATPGSSSTSRRAPRTRRSWPATWTSSRTPRA